MIGAGSGDDDILGQRTDKSMGAAGAGHLYLCAFGPAGSMISHSNSPG